MDIEYSKEGYSIGTITYHKDSKCTYIITDEKSGAKFDPINIDQELFESYRIDNSKIYFIISETTKTANITTSILWSIQ